MIDADPSSAQLTLARLAAEVQLSRYQLLRAFARRLGLTPHAYILQQRLALARRLIRAGRGLAETATRAGFFDQSHLTHRFTVQFGVTPRSIRHDEIPGFCNFIQESTRRLMKGLRLSIPGSTLCATFASVGTLS